MSALTEQIETARTAMSLGVTGRVEAVTGMTVQAVGLPVPLGSLCDIEAGPREVRDGEAHAAVEPGYEGPALGRGGHLAGQPGAAVPHPPVGDRRHTGTVGAEVVGFRGRHTMLMPLSDAGGVSKGRRVRLRTTSQKVAVGPGLVGRVLDGMGRPCDGGGPIAADAHYPLHRPAPDALERRPIDAPLSIGIRSINALLTVGRGVRLGVFAGSGVGKSVLLGMMSRYTSADVSVIALVGERGREVKDFIARELGPRGLKRSVVVYSTSDQSPSLRVRAALVATAIAEYFRDRGKDVLLLVDSVTRVAMAARQIGLAAGEPPATKGYPPSVFAMLPRLLERSGRTTRGSITGLYTVLVEGDDPNDPVADTVRGVLDGHIWLSRRLASRGQYPAVSVLDSISRVMPDVVDSEHAAAAGRVRRMTSVWADIEDLVSIGAYAQGTNPEYDLAIAMRPRIEAFMRQQTDVGDDFEASRAALARLAGEIEAASAQAGSSASRKVER